METYEKYLLERSKMDSATADDIIKLIKKSNIKEWEGDFESHGKKFNQFKENFLWTRAYYPKENVWLNLSYRTRRISLYKADSAHGKNKEFVEKLSFKDSKQIENLFIEKLWDLWK